MSRIKPKGRPLAIIRLRLDLSGLFPQTSCVTTVILMSATLNQLQENLLTGLEWARVSQRLFKDVLTVTKGPHQQPIS